MARLFIKDVNKNEYTFDIPEKGDFTIEIGRFATNDLIFNDAKVSRNHAVIRSEGNDDIVVEDLESSNGVFVNGRRVKLKLLENNDEIRIGDNYIFFRREAGENSLISSIAELKKSTDTIVDSDGNEILLEKKLNFLGSNMVRFAKFLQKEDVAKEQIRQQMKKYISYLGGIKKDFIKLRKEYRSLYFLNRISAAISDIIETRDFFSSSLDIILSLLDAQRGFIMFYNEQSKEFEVKIARQMDSEVRNAESFSHNIVRFVYENDKTVIVNNPDQDNRFTNGKSVIEFNIKAAMAGVLKYKGEKTGVIYIDRQTEGNGFSDVDRKFFDSYVNHCSLTFERVKLYSELEDSYLASIKVLANVLDAKDPYTHGHSERVMEYSVAIARALGLDPKDIKNIEFGALLHDIGKVGVDINILNKPGRLTDEEFEVIKSHPEQGFEIIEPIKFLQDKFAAIKYHHERWDGKGYPESLKGEDIPLEARIVAIADTFDAMTSTRSYRKALDKSVAIEEIRKNSGTQFDPRLVDAFMKVVNRENVTQVWTRGQEVQKKIGDA